jgi:hypothetical protein
MGTPIPIVADTASRIPGLGFEGYADALADAVRGGDPPQFTVGIYGPWGSGKTSLLHAIRSRLEKQGDVIPAFFDAWRYERTGPIVVPLLHAIYTAVAEISDQTVRNQLRRALRALVFSISLNVHGVGLDTKQLREALEEGPDITALDEVFAKPFSEMRKIADELSGKRIVVLIDDLDRCSPENVVALLEAINLVMDVPGLVFILALDYDVLIRAVSQRYPHASGHAFIEKMVQVPFRVPRLDLHKETFLSDLIPDWERQISLLPSRFAEYAYDVATLGLNANPRQIKRFMNSFLVTWRIMQDRGIELDDKILAGLIGLQLRWPQEYQDFAEAFYAGDDQPLALLQSEDTEARLAHYVGQFFPTAISDDQLRQLLHLTEVVAAPSESVSTRDDFEYSPAAERREMYRTEFLTAIEQRGFRRSERSNRLYYHTDVASRIVMGKTVVRLERPNPRRGEYGRDWELQSSFLLSQGVEGAIEAVDKALAKRPRTAHRSPSDLK